MSFDNGNNNTKENNDIMKKGFGWIPDHPSIKDYTPESIQVKDTLSKLMLTSIPDAKTLQLASKIDNRKYCSPIRDQLNLGSCTAFASIGMLEYFQNKTNSNYVQGSPLFLYKVTRKLAGLEGDSGAYMRNAMGALTMFGSPPEKHYPYIVDKFDDEPDMFAYMLAANYQAIKYIRLDYPNLSRKEILNRMKQYISKGFAAMFGFSVYSSFYQSVDDNMGRIPYPSKSDSLLGGHAMLIVGYDDDIVIQHQISEINTTGAFLVRNSWGKDYGDAGYGFIPYQYLLSGLMEDVWCLLKNEWVEEGRFTDED